jgi:VWFA-related protein
MIPRCRRAVFSAVLLATTAVRPALQQTPSLPTEIFLSASDKSGTPLPLASSDLTVLIDKRPTQIAALRSAKDDKLIFAVMVDVSASGAPRSQAIKDAAMRLFDGLSAQGGEGYIVVFSTSTGMSQHPILPSQARSSLDAITFNGGTALLDAVIQTSTTVLSRSANPATPRRAIFLLSDGDDNYSHATLTDAESAAQREGIAIFSLADPAQSREGDSTAGQRGEDVLRSLSKETGGQGVFIHPLSDGASQLLQLMDHQWALDFIPPQSSGPRLHPLSIKSSQKGLEISAPTHIPLP